MDWRPEEKTELVRSFELRPTLRWFSAAMELMLRRNDNKGREAWRMDTPGVLLGRLKDELLELQDALREGASPDKVTQEAADVANFAMMVADSYRWEPED